MSHTTIQTTSSTHSPPQVNSSVGTLRKFRTRTSSQLWSVFALAMAGMFLARMPWLLPNGIKLGQLPTEYYHFRVPLNKALLWMHLACILPSGLFAVFQFVPRIRARAIGFHRNAGKVINVVSLVSTVCAWGIGRVSFGGDLTTQSAVYLLGVMTAWSIIKSWVAIRRLQIDKHRTWIIRAWSYQTSVITERVVMILLFIYFSFAKGYYAALTCDEVAYVLKDQVSYMNNDPQCQPEWAGPGAGMVLVEANHNDNHDLAITASLRVAFGASMWIAIWIHAIGTEYYLFVTQNESNRLRDASAKRQNPRRMLQGTQTGRQ